MLLARHHGKAGTANRITGGLHASADVGPISVTGSSTHTKITPRKGWWEPVGNHRGDARLEKGRGKGRGNREGMARSPGTWHTGSWLNKSHIGVRARSTSQEPRGQAAGLCNEQRAMVPYLPGQGQAPGNLCILLSRGSN